MPSSPETFKQEMTFSSYQSRRYSYWLDVLQPWLEEYWYVIPAIIVAGLISFCTWWFFIRTITVTGTLESLQWSRTVYVQRLDWYNDSSRWGCPEGSRGCYTAWEVVGTQRYASGSHQESRQSCYGTGSNRSCTTFYSTITDYSYRNIYGTVWHYQRPQWDDDHYSKLTGDRSQAKVWPIPTILPGQRQGHSEEELFGNFIAESKTYKCDADTTNWSSAFIGARWDIYLNSSGDLKGCNPQPGAATHGF